MRPAVPRSRVLGVEIAANVVVGIVALLHVYFLVLEMFLWTTPTGRRTFGLDADFAQKSKALAANQGLYNGFLAAGLIWGLLAGGTVGFQAKVFFLACVVVAGVYGAVTVNRRILYVQAVPAASASSWCYSPDSAKGRRPPQATKDARAGWFAVTPASSSTVDQVRIPRSFRLGATRRHLFERLSQARDRLMSCLGRH